MVFADTHTHLYLEEFDTDRDSVIRNAMDAGVRYMMLPNIDSTSIDGLLSLCAQFPSNCFPMMGLHPTSVKTNYREELEIMYGQVSEVHVADMHFTNLPIRYRAIGEIGIDLYWDKTYREQQVEAFLFQVELALAHDLPVVIHTRNSFDLTIDILEKMKEPALKGVFHCFGGNLPQAERAIALGFKLGIGGIVTYKNSGIQPVIEAVGLEHLVLETDAPFLTPVPHRGQRNESSFIPIIAQKIADLKQLSIEQVARITTENALSLFKIHL